MTFNPFPVLVPLVGVLAFMLWLKEASKIGDPALRINRWLRIFLNGRAALATGVAVFECGVLAFARGPFADSTAGLALLGWLASVFSFAFMSRMMIRVAGGNMREFKATQDRTYAKVEKAAVIPSLILYFLLIRYFIATAIHAPAFVALPTLVLAVFVCYMLPQRVGVLLIKKTPSAQIPARTAEIFEEVKQVLGFPKGVLRSAILPAFARGDRAAAIGSKTVMVAPSFGHDLTEQEQRFVLGHELGHLITGDAAKRLQHARLNLLLIYFVPFLLAQGLWISGYSHWIVNLAAGSYMFSAYAVLFWLGIRRMARYRNMEFVCDEFGYRSCGSASAAISALERINESFKLPLLALSDQYTHPSMEQRFERLNRLESAKPPVLA